MALSKKNGRTSPFAGPAKIFAKLKAKLPIPGKKPGFELPESAEPFASIIDDTHTADFAAEPNAVVQRRKKQAAEAFDFKALGKAALANKMAVAIAAIVAVFGLAILAVTFIVGAPPTAGVSSRRVDPDGEALARRLLLPADRTLFPRLELEREPKQFYSDDDVARYATSPTEADLSSLASKNDEAARRLLETVP